MPQFTSQIVSSTLACNIKTRKVKNNYPLLGKLQMVTSSRGQKLLPKVHRNTEQNAI
jgi:hypothetical protein